MMGVIVRLGRTLCVRLLLGVWDCGMATAGGGGPIGACPSIVESAKG